MAGVTICFDGDLLGHDCLDSQPEILAFLFGCDNGVPQNISGLNTFGDEHESLLVIVLSRNGGEGLPYTARLSPNIQHAHTLFLPGFAYHQKTLQSATIVSRSRAETYCASRNLPSHILGLF